MRANAGDRIVVKGHHVGALDRDAEILEVHGEDGAPPYVVRWSDDGHEGLFFPGSDASVQHFGAADAVLESASESDDNQGDDDQADNDVEAISVDECLDLLASRAVGRIAITTVGGLVIVPVNYRFVQASDLRWIAFRTRLGGLLDRSSQRVAFEIDEVDDTAQTGWSVLVRGTLQHVDPDAADFRARFDSESWVADRGAWMVVEPYAIEGRRVQRRSESPSPG